MDENVMNGPIVCCPEYPNCEHAIQNTRDDVWSGQHPAESEWELLVDRTLTKLNPVMEWTGIRVGNQEHFRKEARNTGHAILMSMIHEAVVSFSGLKESVAESVEATKALALKEPTSDLHTAKQKELSGRITQYLCVGGLFNPEMMEHDKVRDLLMDVRDFLDAPSVGRGLSSDSGSVVSPKNNLSGSTEGRADDQQSGKLPDTDQPSGAVPSALSAGQAKAVTKVPSENQVSPAQNSCGVAAEDGKGEEWTCVKDQPEGSPHRRIWCGDQHIGNATRISDARAICDAHNSSLSRLRGQLDYYNDKLSLH